MQTDLQQQRVAVLFGGCSSEREVSLSSGQAILRALRDASDGRGPAHVIGVEVTPSGAWSVEGEAPLTPALAIERVAPDVWFIGLHGGEGEDGHVQGFLRSLEQSHTASGLASSSLAMNKFAALAVTERAGLDIPRGVQVSRDVLDDSTAFAGLSAVRSTSGWFVKPVHGGSSVGAGPAHDEASLRARLTESFEYDDALLVEEALGGIEAAVAVLDLCGSPTHALPPIEIRPHAGRFFDYEEKYSNAGAEEFCPAQSFSVAQLQSLQAAALTAHRVLGAEGYSRSDFLVLDQRVVFLELNTLPGFTDRSLVPQEAHVVGIEYRDLCLAIAADGIAREVRS